jgi:serine/threonine-protein kinase
MVVDARGIVFVVDMDNNRVRQINVSTGAVTTLAGSGAVASSDGTGTAAAFKGPRYLALDGLGNLYVTEYATHRIRKVVLATQAVTTVAGTGVAGAVDGVGVAASFNKPRGIACDANGNAYITDGGNYRVRKMVLSSATVTTLAGSVTASFADGVGSNAGFSGISNVAVNPDGTHLFIADGPKIRQIVIATQNVTTLAGNSSVGDDNGVGSNALFRTPMVLVADSSGNLFIGDSGNNLIRKIVIATQTVTTLAGSGTAAWVDGFGISAAFQDPRGLAIDARGNLLVADSGNHRVRVLQATVPCPPGYFCAAGADRALCDVGYYCPSGSSAQVACPATGAFHCPAGASAPVFGCAAGYVYLGNLFLHSSWLCDSFIFVVFPN